MHAAGICLGTIQARTHVQLALACQQSMIRAQQRLRLTMQHLCGHGGNLGNECADHVAVARRCWLGGWVWCGVVDMSLSRGPSRCVVREK